MTETEKKAKEEAKSIINGHKFVDLGLPSGLKWATCNVGADSPEKYGDYYAWGELYVKSEYASETSKTNDKMINDISGNSTYDVARAKWGSSWRMPTDDEFHELMSFRCKWQWTTQGGTRGFKVYGPNGNCIFLPAAGIYIDSQLYHAGKEAHYWTSRPVKKYDCDDHANYLLFYNYHYEIECTYRHYGHSVRPVSE